LTTLCVGVATNWCEKWMLWTLWLCHFKCTLLVEAVKVQAVLGILEADIRLGW